MSLSGAQVEFTRRRVAVTAISQQRSARMAQEFLIWTLQDLQDEGIFNVFPPRVVFRHFACFDNSLSTDAGRQGDGNCPETLHDEVPQQNNTEP